MNKKTAKKSIVKIDISIYFYQARKNAISLILFVRN